MYPAFCALALVSNTHLPPPHRHFEFEHFVAGMILNLYKFSKQKKTTRLDGLFIWLLWFNVSTDYIQSV